ANAPSEDARIIVVDVDPAHPQIPTYEFTADVRITSDARLATRALQAAAEGLLSNSDRQRIADRTARWADATWARHEQADREAQANATRSPIDTDPVACHLGHNFCDNT